MEMKNNSDLGCLVVPMFIGFLYFLYQISELPKDWQFPIGLIGSVVVVVALILARFFDVKVSKKKGE